MTRHKAIGTLELNTFREHFRDFQQQYIIIGGTATRLLLEEAGFSARTTKDLDIVICVESLTPEFVKHFWTFVQAGGYEVWHKANGQRCLYRFEKPRNKGYPEMLELLSDRNQILEDSDHGIISLTISDETVSLSAILLNPEYYRFLLENRRVIEGIVIANEIVLIPMKARAFLDLSLKKQKGETVKGDDIRKHKNDVYRLAQLLTNSPLKNVPEIIKTDISSFVREITDQNHILTQLCAALTDIAEIKKTLLTVYCDDPNLSD